MGITLKNIADEANVSIKTVSRVINSDPKVSGQTRKKVQELIDKRGYEPNLIARSLKNRKTNTVGFIVPDIGNPSFADIAKGCYEVFDKNGYYVFLSSSENSPEKEIEIIKDLLSMVISGIILIPATSVKRDLKFFADMKCPIVILDREIDGLNKDKVVLSNKKGAYDATRVLIDSGNRRIVFLGGLEGAKTAQKRFEGFKKAMDEKGIFDEKYVLWGDFSIDSGYLMMNRAFAGMERKIEAVFASDDLIALGAMNSIKENGLKIPEDISIIGFDDMFFTAYLNPPLSTVHVPFKDEGAIAARLLLKKMENPASSEGDRVIVDTSIILRESVSILSQ
ncbi:MAG: LacI family DNA-binding transcriptional regulator [Candidatus Humimicrobiaceae bacterium]